MRRTSVPKPKNGRQQPMPRGKSKMGESLDASQTETISQENKENELDNNNDNNKGDKQIIDNGKGNDDVSVSNDTELVRRESFEKTGFDDNGEDGNGNKKADNTLLSPEDKNNSSSSDIEMETHDNKLLSLATSTTDGGGSYGDGKVKDREGAKIETSVVDDATGNEDELKMKDDIILVSSQQAGKETEDNEQQPEGSSITVDKEVGGLSDDTRKDETSVDVTDNDDVDKELMMTEEEEERVLSEKDLEDEWKKLTEEPNYPSLQIEEHLTTSRRSPATNQTPPRDDVTRLTNQSRYNATSVPPLHIPESVRWTHRQTPTYRSNRAISDIPYSSFSYQQKHPIRQNTSRRHSIPKPFPSSKEPYTHHQHPNNDTENNPMDDNQMLVSARKLDGLLFRLFYKSQNINNSKYPLGAADTNRGKDNVTKTQEASTLPIFDHSGSDIISMDPVTWQLRPMGSVEKETLQSELPYLEENLDCKEIIKKLFMEGILTHLDYNQLTHTEGQGGRAVTRLLIGTLQRRGDRAYPAFMQALKDLSHIRVYDKLESTERELSRGLEEDRDEMERRTRMETLNEQNALPLYRPSTLGNSFPGHTNNRQLHTIPSSPSPPSPPSPSSPKQQQPPPPEGSSTRDTHREDYDKEVEKQLTELNVELKALHEDINNLRSSRANGPQQDGNPNNPQAPPKSSSCVIL